MHERDLRTSPRQLSNERQSQPEYWDNRIASVCTMTHLLTNLMIGRRVFCRSRSEHDGPRALSLRVLWNPPSNKSNDRQTRGPRALHHSEYFGRVDCTNTSSSAAAASCRYNWAVSIDAQVYQMEPMHVASSAAELGASCSTKALPRLNNQRHICGDADRCLPSPTLT
jgi:hypothetical protein